MATLYGANATKRDVTNPSVKIDACDERARVRMIYDAYTLVGDLASGDLINFAKVPAGCRIVDVWVFFTDLDASGGTIDVGWAADSLAVETADDDGFIANADCTSADVIKMSDNLANGAGQFKKFAAECQVQAKVDGDTDATTGSIGVAVFYTLD